MRSESPAIRAKPTAPTVSRNPREFVEAYVRAFPFNVRDKEVWSVLRKAIEAKFHSTGGVVSIWTHALSRESVGRTGGSVEAAFRRYDEELSLARLEWREARRLPAPAADPVDRGLILDLIRPLAERWGTTAEAVLESVSPRRHCLRRACAGYSGADCGCNCWTCKSLSGLEDRHEGT